MKIEVSMKIIVELYAIGVCCQEESRVGQRVGIQFLDNPHRYFLLDGKKSKFLQFDAIGMFVAV